MTPSSFCPPIFLSVLTTVLLVRGACAKELYVAPNGSPQAKGTKDEPLDLQTALSNADLVKPGDTVWLLGGRYQGPFGISGKPSGTPEQPIVYRAWPGERVTLVGVKDKRGALGIGGRVQHVWFWGFEITDASGGIDLGRAGEIKLINLVIHDNPRNTGLGGSSLGGEWYGCLIYRNGEGSNAFAHGTYTQNRPDDVGGDLAKLPWNVHRDCVVFRNFGWGVHSYATSPKLAKLRFEGVVAYGNGDLAGMEKPTVNFLAGGCQFDDLIEARDCFTYYPDKGNFKRGTDLGYENENGRVTVERCRFVGGVDALWLQQFQQAQVHGSTFLTANGCGLKLTTPKEHDFARYDFQQNTYYKLANPPLMLNEQTFDGLEAWQKATGLDKDSQMLEGRPDKPWVFLRPNHYEPERALLIVYNWPKTRKVSVDLAKLWPSLKPDTPYRIVSVEDVWGKPSAEGQLADKPVEVAMEGVYAPEFACYLVITLPVDQ